jgi:excisionase family DNA binding protein
MRSKLPLVGVGVSDAAESLGVSDAFIRLEIARGKLEILRAGRRVLIKKSSYDEYVQG